MANIPEDAQRSDDGHYWWDGQTWQPTEQGAVGTDAGDGSADGTGDTERVAARIAAGYPAAAEHLTDEQQRTLLAEPVVAVEPISHEEVEVVAMEGHEDGKATA